jgi:hypothetical protein
MLGAAGVTAMEAKVAAVTVNVLVLLTLPMAALMVVLPSPVDCATPMLPVALLMVATLRLDELQVALPVMSRVEPSLKRPNAVNPWIVPLAMLGAAGDTVRETSVAAVTVRVLEPERAPSAAEMEVLPAAFEVARPCEPKALLTLAVPGSEDDQVTVAVKS